MILPSREIRPEETRSRYHPHFLPLSETPTRPHPHPHNYLYAFDKKQLKKVKAREVAVGGGRREEEEVVARRACWHVLQSEEREGS